MKQRLLRNLQATLGKDPRRDIDRYRRISRSLSSSDSMKMFREAGGDYIFLAFVKYRNSIRMEAL